MLAYRLKNKKYRLADEKKGEVYDKRDIIKDWGGHWDQNRRSWIVSPECAEVLEAKKIFRVLLDSYCCTPSEFYKEGITVYEPELVRKWTTFNCSMCDSKSVKKIIKVLQEAEYAT